MPGPLKADPGDFTFLPENPVAPANPVASALRKNPALGATGGVGAFAREQSNQAEQRARQAQTEGFQQRQQERAQAFQQSQSAAKAKELQPLSLAEIAPNPDDKTGKTGLAIFHDKFGNVVKKVVPIPPPGNKGSGATPEDIQRALNQAENLIPLLGTVPGPPANIGYGIRWYKAHSGYPGYGQFGAVSSTLADMIPKALAGRASTSAIKNALENQVPGMGDTKESAQEKIDYLRYLFTKSGALPSAPAKSELPPSSMIPEGMILPLNHKGKVHYYQKRNGQVSEVGGPNG